jgi:Tfp pilus assembly protein PilO
MANLFPILMLVASIGLFVGYIDPQYSEIKSLQSQKADYDQALVDANKLGKKRDDLLTQINSFKQEDLTRLSKLLPDNIDNVRLIIDIDEIAKQYGMRIRNFITSQTKKEQGYVGDDQSTYGTLALSFSTSGTYEQFVAFMGALESSLRLVDIVSIEFIAAETNISDFNVTIKTHWLK